MIKLIVLDLDGTLLRSDNSVSEPTKHALRQLVSTGVKIAFATGQIRAVAEARAEDVGITPFLICANGATVVDDEGNVLVDEPLERNLALDMLRWLEANHICNNAYVDDRRVSSRKYCTGELGRSRVPDNMQGDVAAELQRHPSARTIKMGAALQDSSGLLDLQKQILQRWGTRVECFITTPRALECVTKGVSKERALRSIMSVCQVTPDEVMAFGDAQNDLSLMRVVGTPVAMGNAVPEVKAIASIVTTSNNEDGVLAVLNTLL